VVGSTRVVDGAPLVAAAVGYDMWADLEGFGGPPAGDREAPEAVASEAPVARQPHR
jgi:hypothetical protein